MKLGAAFAAAAAALLLAGFTGGASRQADDAEPPTPAVASISSMDRHFVRQPSPEHEKIGSWLRVDIQSLGTVVSGTPLQHRDVSMEGRGQWYEGDEERGPFWSPEYRPSAWSVRIFNFSRDSPTGTWRERNVTWTDFQDPAITTIREGRALGAMFDMLAGYTLYVGTPGGSHLGLNHWYHPAPSETGTERLLGRVRVTHDGETYEAPENSTRLLLDPGSRTIFRYGLERIEAGADGHVTVRYDVEVTVDYWMTPRAELAAAA